MSHGSNLVWTDDVVARLRALWLAGISTTEIGRQIGVTKNAVIGKAHRLQLDPRQSSVPPREGMAPKRSRLKPQPAPALKNLADSSAVGLIPRAVPATTLIPALPIPRPTLCPPRRVLGSYKACCWPIGDPGKPGFRFCEQPADAGKPYCPPHRAAAHKPRVHECDSSTDQIDTP